MSFAISNPGAPSGVARAPRAVAIAAAIFFIVYVALDLNKFWALRYGADSGTFVQWMVGEFHGRGSWNSAEYRPHLQVHDSWMLLGLVPLLGLLPFAQTLIVLQVAAIAAAAIPLAAFARACGANARGAAAVAIAYLISPSAQGLAYGNFLENVFVPVVAAAGALFVRRRTLLPTLVIAQVLLGLKEDQALFIAWFAVACWLWWDRRIGAALFCLAVLNGGAFALYERIAGVHPSIPAYGWTIANPLQKLLFLIQLFAPFAFAPLMLRWRLLLGLPLFAEIAFNGPWAYQLTRIGTHWTASLVAATAIAAAYVVAKHPRFAVPMVVFAALCALTINDTVLKIGRWPYVVDRQAYAAASALREQTQRVIVRRPVEGIYVVAASNPNIVLAPYDPHEQGYCPAYNTNARAFFASIGIGSWPQGLRLCGGVPVVK